MGRLTPKQLRELRATAVAPGANRVAKAIELAEVTQEDVARGTDLTQPYISHVARNVYDTTTVKNAQKFAEFFGCTVDDLWPAREAVAS